ncbi:Autophagy protein 5 [Abeliophyllum distichum]|uniref:Autophagy protein 5 n=1 Tax=Abeliophyllum distichum TaxID=126358 RepID=A0ABD1STN0_9LAMI
MDSKGGGGTEAQKFVWEGAIPLQIHLHDSEVTTLPNPSPALILAPRLGYLPLLVSQIKPFFSNSLPPGVDTVWFEYKGLPLKWYIPTGVLFDLLCAEAERPWNLTVHFRGYPGNFLTPCEDEDSVKWSFINALKEAAYIITGNCKNIMSMSQSDQADLWHSVLNGNMEAYLRVSSKLKLGTIGDDYSLKLNFTSNTCFGHYEGSDLGGFSSGRIPVRLYIRSINEDINDLEDAPTVDSWDKISYINRPVEIQGEGQCFTLYDAVKALLPELFADKHLLTDNVSKEEAEDGQQSEEVSSSRSPEEVGESLTKHAGSSLDTAEIKVIRIQGIEPKVEIPFGWVVNNLMNPEHYLHICAYIKVVEPIII